MNYLNNKQLSAAIANIRNNKDDYQQIAVSALELARTEGNCTQIAQFVKAVSLADSKALVKWFGKHAELICIMKGANREKFAINMRTGKANDIKWQVAAEYIDMNAAEADNWETSKPAKKPQAEFTAQRGYKLAADVFIRGIKKGVYGIDELSVTDFLHYVESELNATLAETRAKLADSEAMAAMKAAIAAKESHQRSADVEHRKTFDDEECGNVSDISATVDNSDLDVGDDDSEEELLNQVA